VVRRANGYTPVRVSTFAIENELQSYPTISDAVGFGYQYKGHDFYRLSFPAADKTWEYDASNGLWHRCSFWNKQAGRETLDRGMFHTFNFGKHLLGDPVAPSIYEMSGNILDDFGNAIKRTRRVSPINNEQKWMLHYQMQVYLETGLATFDSADAPTSFILAAPNGNLFAVTMSDLGVVQSTPIDTGEAETLFINAATGTSWQIKPNNVGVLKPVPIESQFEPSVIEFISTSGILKWDLLVNDLGSGIGQFQTVPQGKLERGPLMMLRFSNDSGHTWSEEYTVDCGQLGEYQARAVFRRLGRARNRVYEISVTDPVPWNIIDGFLDAA